MGLRKKNEWWDETVDDPEVCAASSQRGRGRGWSQGWGGHGSHQRSAAVTAAFARVDAWGLKEGTCWNCFEEHGIEESDDCAAKNPCAFCNDASHRSAFCSSSPASKEEFDAALEKLRR